VTGGAIDPDRLDVLRALAEPARHQLYRELQGASEPLTTPELARRVALHPNTVRAHLEQLCAVGLVRADTTGDGNRGRPRHRFSAVSGPAADSGQDLVVPVAPPRPEEGPAPVATPPPHPVADPLTAALVQVAQLAGVEPGAIRRVGQRSGHERAAGLPSPGSTAEAVDNLVAAEVADGYAPSIEREGPGRWRLSFLRCPYRDLAERAPQVVCSLHAGSVQGTCEATGRLALESFVPLQPDGPCYAVVGEVAAVAGSETERR
jgi:predicted ArsR family transcriptional regulator